MSESRVAKIKAFYGAEPRTSSWLVVDQTMINQFGAATLDSDWLHTDPDRASREGPFEGTVAYGFWTISLLTYFGREIMGTDYPAGAAYGLNYGFDRLRLMAPVPVGKRIRATTRLLDVTPRGENRYVVKTEYSVEVEATEKPAMVAEWLFLLGFNS